MDKLMGMGRLLVREDDEAARSPIVEGKSLKFSEAFKEAVQTWLRSVVSYSEPKFVRGYDRVKVEYDTFAWDVKITFGGLRSKLASGRDPGTLPDGGSLMILFSLGFSNAVFNLELVEDGKVTRYTLKPSLADMADVTAEKALDKILLRSGTNLIEL
jgi:hypothetical protein